MNFWHNCCDLIKKSKSAVFANSLESLPVFLLTDSIVDNVDEVENLADTFNLILENDNIFLPFEKFIIQENMSDHKDYQVCNFYIIDTTLNNDPKDVVSSVIQYSKKTDSYLVIYTGLRLKWIENGEVLTSLPQYIHEKYKTKLEEVVSPFRRVVAQLVVSTSTRGMSMITEKAPEKLNKKRIKNGKTPISDTIYIRASHYYDKDGKEHIIDEKSPVRIHWRRGHIRGVRHGIRRSEIKQVYIQPCLVNFKSDNEVPDYKTYKVSA